MLYRCGEFKRAVAVLDGLKEHEPYGQIALLFAAMAHHQLGNRELANERLDKAEQQIVAMPRYDGEFSEWYDRPWIWTTLTMLLDEARTLIRKK